MKTNADDTNRTDGCSEREPPTQLIRNSTAEFLIFTGQSGEQSIEARYENETIWLSQKLMAELFDVDVRTVSEHLGNIYDEGELSREATIRKFRIVQTEGTRQVNRSVDFYNLDAIISVGYRVNSVRATQFRQWATQVLREFAIKGYVLDRKRLENGAFLGEDYFERLLEEIREIRLSERRFYQKITDIYSTAVDYNEDAPKDKILRPDAQLAKNYLTQEELEALGRIVNAFLDLAENRARRRIPMTMEDWAKRLDDFLEMDDRRILEYAGSVTAEAARTHAEIEFAKYRVIQNRLFESDFDREIQHLEKRD